MRAGEVDWSGVWRCTYDALAQNMSGGVGHLLTEDSVRFATALAHNDLGELDQGLS
jgi:hypothetical protein